MRTQASLPAPDPALDEVVLPPDALAVIRAVAQAFTAHRPAAPLAQDVSAKLPPLLKPQQAADLTGWSRQAIEYPVRWKAAVAAQPARAAALPGDRSPSGVA